MTVDQHVCHARTRSGRAAALALAGLVTLAGCGREEVTSAWCDREVRIDGRNEEWAGALRDYPDDQVTVGVMNDDEFLYVAAFVGGERTRMHAVLGGFTLWLDGPDGERRLGLRYPPGLPERHGRRGNRRDAVLPRHGRSLGFAAGPAITGGDLEVYDSGDEPPRFVPVDESGVDVAVKPYETSIAYELRIPLAEGDGRPFAVEAAPGTVIGVRLTIGASGRPPSGEAERGPGPDEEPEPGDLGPGGMGGLGDMGPEGRREPGTPRSVEIRAEVTLATGPGAAAPRAAD